MIDIHTHILPGIDDGAADFDESLDLARAAVADGITAMIATPHHANGRYMNDAAFTREQVERLRESFAAHKIPLDLYIGQEVRIHSDMFDAWSAGELATLAGSRYILLEMPSSTVPKRMLEYIHEFTIMGIRPIIAHPERNAEVVQNPDKLREMVDAGAYGQVTTHSILGGFGKQIERSAWQLCRTGLIHTLSSDAHHIHRRGFRLREAYDRVRSELGEQFEQCYIHNAEAIIANQELIESPVTKTRQKGKSWRNILNFFQS
ncbi:tyrosine-protein phosphatase [Paenibacillus montanisoli]|uniref:Tyrosine-protein phosphatase n=1 Tax=Paenibacillus montanisoli TaxID=2081970 RepID=A0A328TUM1_9BACL|nr:CpsB/CapC family capsule biosynthesis tyrosine phosphatase [Paenibacillus montanisoli]RAP74020.1 protein tyrosine phosphatase [Paenibacillus montanisoli]